MRLWRIGAVALALAATLPATASAATLTVDDDRADCPSAGFTSVQAAVNAASAGDTVAICPGTYEEGPATVPSAGANAVNITKMITLRGAGADKVTIRPKPSIVSLLGTTTTYRNGTGAVIGVNRSGVRTIVDVSGITVEGGTTAVGAGVKFFNSEGTLTSSRIRNVAPLTAAQGYGVVIASTLSGDRLAVRIGGPTVNGVPVGVEISGYAKAGVVLDSTQQAPAQGVLAATIQNNTITGAGPQSTAAQQGVLATGLVSGSVTANVITGNRLDDGDAGTTTDDVSSAGVRLVDLDLTPVSATSSNTKLTATGNTISGNGYGARNETGAGADQATPFTATGNYWGVATGPSIGLPRVAGDPVNGALPGPAANSTTAVNYASFRTTPIPLPVVPGTTGDALPTGEVDPPAGEIDPVSKKVVVRSGTAYTLRAAAGDDFGVKSVAFSAGATALGEDAGVPYVAPSVWTPDAALEGQSVDLIATITDSSGQVTPVTLEVTVKPPPPPPPPPPAAPPPVVGPPVVALPVARPAERPTRVTLEVTVKPPPPPPPIASPSPVVGPPVVALPVARPAERPTRVTLAAAAARKRKLTLTGSVGLPAGVACPAGATVRVTVYLGGKRLERRQATVDAACAYRLSIKLPARAAGRKVLVKARFDGHDTLLARLAPARTVTVKR